MDTGFRGVADPSVLYMEIESLLLKNVCETGRELGHGAYGLVTEVKVNETICAAKKLHDIIVQVRFNFVKAEISAQPRCEVAYYSMLSH